jgi:ribosomal protein S27E
MSDVLRYGGIEYFSPTHIKCPNCENSVEYETISKKLVKSDVTGKTIHETSKYASHKKNGLLSLKCPNSGAVFERDVFYQSAKVGRIKCKFCKKFVWAFKLRDKEWTQHMNREYDYRHRLRIWKLFTHTNHNNRCFGSGKIVKDKSGGDFIDNNHP